jgi:methionyl-tRNA formyltransferase
LSAGSNDEPFVNPLRIIFMGTAPLACASLESLNARPDFCVVAVVTQPDRAAGRDLKLQPSAVKQMVMAKGLPVLQPERARSPEFLDQLRQLQPELIVVAAYGQILPQAILDLPRYGCLNVHTSLLPKYRGAAPIQWAILNGDAETGVTIMQMDAGLDTGSILTAERTAITPDDDAQTLHDRLAQMGARLLVGTIPGYIAGTVVPRPQPAGGASYARKITKDDGHLDWNKPATQLWNQVRGLTPWPGAFTDLAGHAKLVRLKIWRASPEESQHPSAVPGEIVTTEAGGILVCCGQGVLRIRELQREGGRRLAAKDFLTGFPLREGQRLQ